ncbi:MAG: hypothetical protein ACI33J_12985 [Clostridium sp.]
MFGVGNGLQGYYYKESLNENDYKSEEVKNVIRGKSGIPLGGSFMTSFISVYGLISVFLLIIFIYISIKKNNEFYYIYLEELYFYSYLLWLKI